MGKKSGHNKAREDRTGINKIRAERKISSDFYKGANAIEPPTPATPPVIRTIVKKDKPKWVPKKQKFSGVGSAGSNKATDYYKRQAQKAEEQRERILLKKLKPGEKSVVQTESSGRTFGEAPPKVVGLPTDVSTKRAELDPVEQRRLMLREAQQRKLAAAIQAAPAPAAPAPQALTCPAGHKLKAWKTPEEDEPTQCDSCYMAQNAGAMMHGCRHCDFDLCHKCFSKDGYWTPEKGGTFHAAPTAPSQSAPIAHSQSTAAASRDNLSEKSMDGMLQRELAEAKKLANQLLSNEKVNGIKKKDKTKPKGSMLGPKGGISKKDEQKKSRSAIRRLAAREKKERFIKKEKADSRVAKKQQIEQAKKDRKKKEREREERQMKEDANSRERAGPDKGGGGPKEQGGRDMRGGRDKKKKKLSRTQKRPSSKARSKKKTKP